MNTKACLRGRVIRFLDDKRIIAVVETDSGFGDALLDVNANPDWDVKPGDEIEIEDADWYVLDGRIVTIASGIIIQSKIITGKHWQL